MTAIPHTRVSGIQPFVRFLREIGAPVERLLEPDRLEWAVEADPETPVPLRLVGAFLERAARTQEVEDLGAVVGARSSLLEVGDYGRLIHGSATLREALDRGIRLIQRQTSAFSHWYTRAGDRVRWHCSFNVARTEGARHLDHFATLLAIDTVRQVAGPAWCPPALWLASGISPGLARFEALAQARPAENGRVTTLELEAPLLGLPFPRTVPGRGDEAGFAASAPPTGFLASARQAVASLLPSGYPPIELLARAGGTSVRTFQRRLAVEGFSYSRLVEEVRFESARRLLGDPRVSLLEISLRLGYGDQANFTRAFRRWTGQSPRTFRRAGAAELRTADPAGADMTRPGATPA